MGVVTVITFLLCFVGMKLCFAKDSIHDDYLSKPCADSVKGIFVLMVLNGHLSQYIELGNTLLEWPYILVEDWISQCIVAPFLFCSGYGIFYSFVNKQGLAYIKGMPRKRMLPTLVHFDLALILFLIMNLILGIQYTPIEYITALVGWNSVGNSTWFIYATLCMYVIVYIAGHISWKLKDETKRLNCFTVLTLLGTVAYILIMMNFKQHVYYNTILCFPVGVIYGRFKEKIDVQMKKLSVWLIVAAVLAAVYLCSLVWGNYYWRAPVFAVLVCVITMRFRICNPILHWLGSHIFEIYILQRLPQIIFSELGFNKNQYIFAALCIPVTLVGAWLFKKLMKQVDRLLLPKQKVAAGKE